VNKSPAVAGGVASFFGPFLNREALRLLVLGFAAGLPIILVFGTLSAWLRDAGLERSTIGFVSWVTLAYGFKWVWSPLVDGLGLGGLTRTLGRRRGWLLLAQLAVVAGLVGMALNDPSIALEALVACAVLTAFSSATQDIVIDAYRIECAPVDRQAALAATYMAGYRLGMIVSGAGAFYIAAWFDPDEAVYDYASWRSTYLTMAWIMSLPILLTLSMPEPDASVMGRTNTPDETAARSQWGFESLLNWLDQAVLGPFADFLRRYGWTALVVLAVIGSYRISDIVLGVIANVFYIDMGFTKAQIASVAKIFGVFMTLLGAFLGGAMAPRIGLGRMLLLGALLVSLTNLLFAWLAGQPPTTVNLALVIGADNLSAGLATAAFIAYLSGITNLKFSATQYALFSSFMVLPPKLLGGYSGAAVDLLGYPQFFIMCSLLGVPVLLLLLLLRRVTSVDEGAGG